MNRNGKDVIRDHFLSHEKREGHCATRYLYEIRTEILLQSCTWRDGRVSTKTLLHDSHQRIDLRH